jgi:hypothetical protein
MQSSGQNQQHAWVTVPEGPKRASVSEDGRALAIQVRPCLRAGPRRSLSRSIQDTDHMSTWTPMRAPIRSPVPVSSHGIFPRTLGPTSLLFPTLLQWDDGQSDTPTYYTSTFLHHHMYSLARLQQLSAARRTAPVCPQAAIGSAGGVVKIDYSRVMESEEGVREWVEALARDGESLHSCVTQASRCRRAQGPRPILVRRAAQCDWQCAPCASAADV